MEPTEDRGSTQQLKYASPDAERPDAQPLVRPVLPYLVFVVCAGLAGFCWCQRDASVINPYFRDVLMVVSGLASIVLPILLQIERLMNTLG